MRGMKHVDRRISCAPMMDWSDVRNSAFYINNLGLLESSCHLYGTSKFRQFAALVEDDGQRVREQ